MLIPCAIALRECLPCNDDPIANISAEAPDVNVFIGFRDFRWNPPLGVTYFQLACKTLCFSEVSQEEADLCALQGAQECVWNGGAPPVVPAVPPGPDDAGGNGGGPGLPPQRPRNPIPTYRNTAQSCEAFCPDGSPYTEVVPAGIISALSQSLADQQAYSLACIRATSSLFCITGGDAPASCVGEGYFFQLVASSGDDLIWSVDGTIPPGLEFDVLDGSFSGTPTVNGSYPMTVQVSDSLGRVQTQDITICVMEIVTASELPDGTLGLVYAVPLVQQPAEVSSENWTLVSGSLPPGITLAANGSLTGIPTEAGSFSFTLRVTANCV